MKLVIFDFCETLVNFQTADSFSRFVLEKESRNFILKIDTLLDKIKFYRFCYKLNLDSWSQKKFLLSNLNGLSKEKIKSYAELFLESKILPNLNEKVFEKFLNHLNANDFVIINSGGYQPYLDLFVEKYGVKKLFSTEFKYEGSIFTGKIEGIDCLGQEKVRKMKEEGLNFNDYEEIIVYSDSITDMPIFNLATTRVAIINKNSIPSWCKEKFEIIKV